MNFTFIHDYLKTLGRSPGSGSLPLNAFPILVIKQYQWHMFKGSPLQWRVR